MDWIIGLLLLLCGAVIGFFVARFGLGQKSDSTSGINIEQDLKRMLAEQGAIHVEECRQILAGIEQQSALLKTQLEHYESLLEPQQTDEDAPQLSYFGEHTAAYLRNQAKKTSPVKQTTDYQPRDYANTGTGLFTGQRGKDAASGD
ncbi:ZapG family protein [Bowmanella dokdonensis]|uniref:DUF1043 family protein n=1 Tax=Bowmanella dokdonensis TaxID=751969 RepID=A0A939ILC4_9ALTE|nr:DUF1043 family protein [Bowmanella dokdonensis]MBN7824068.1 DUF1043 family protein [Bowmanella dokdonensis]